MSTEHADRVLVVGGGPVGWTTALLLQREGIPFTLLEAADRVFDDPRAGTIHPPTLELYAAVGATERMLDRGFTVGAYHYYDRREGLVAAFDLSVLADDTAYPFRLMLEQHEVCFVLQELVAEGGGADVRLLHRVTGVAQDGDGVVATVDTPSGVETIRGRYVVGCDGGRSVVRKSMAVGFDGFTYPERFLILSTPYDFGQHGYAFTNYVADPEEWFALFRVPGGGSDAGAAQRSRGDRDHRRGGPGLWRVVSPVDPELAEEDFLTDDAVQARMQRFRAHPDSYDVVHRNVYDVHQRVASAYRDGRMLLAGDAAHINNPLGGMGMNFGIHDAFNLVDKLAAVWRGDAGSERLDAYDRQRRTVAQEFLQRQTIENKNAIAQTDPSARAAFYDDLRAIVADPDRLRAYLRRVTMIDGFERSLAIT